MAALLVVLYVDVENADETVDRAVAAGARVLMPLTDQFGDRTAWIIDPSGHVWTVAARIEEKTTEEQRQERLTRMRATSTSQGQ